MKSAPQISVLILTRNESCNLPRCLEALRWCHDIVVLDSCSTDTTQEIARAFGARVYERPFDDYASQRNYGLNEIDYKNSWLLMVDADEEVPQELVTEMSHVIANCDDNVCLFRMRRKDFFLGKWIRRSGGYPTWFGRLARIGKVRVTRAINEEYHTEGDVALLDGHLNHYPFNSGFEVWFERHNRYSSMEAEQKVSSRPRTSLRALISVDPALRRKTLKSIVYSMPCRPLFVFFGLYLLRGGILEGRAGFLFSVLRMFYEFMIDCKVVELRRRQNRLVV